MAQLVTKFKYLKPTARMSAGGYAKYIATREGVEKIDVSQKYLPATAAQKKLIERILKDFPDSKKTLEYEDYLQSKTTGTASEFISRAVEDNAAASARTYADYIALRPRAQCFGAHGLFTDDGIPVQLAKVSAELNEYKGNVYTAVISLRREDAVRLGFDCGERWRDMLRSQTQALADGLKIPVKHLRWFAAFHNEGHHPHVHLIAYATDPREGHLSRQGVNLLRASLARDIFAQDLLCSYEQQTRQRDALKQTCREVVAVIIEQINHGSLENPAVEKLLLELSAQLSKAKGKKHYGYLRPEVKRLVDEIIDALAKDERIAALYDLWRQSREQMLHIYHEGAHDSIPLSANREFRSIKNMVIQEALRLIPEEETPAEMDESPAAVLSDDSVDDNGKEPDVCSADPSQPNPRQAALCLLQGIARAMQGGILFQPPDERRVDRRLRRKTAEKEQAHGLKHS